MNRKHFKVYDEDSGEEKDVIEWREGDRIRNVKQDEYYYKYKVRTADKTDFVWIKFKYNSPFLPLFKSSTITRLMVFSSFCKKDGFVMFNNSIKGMLNLNSNQLADFRKELFDSEFLINDKSRLFINDSFCSKGEISNPDNNYIRLFSDAIRNLYFSCKSSSEHKVLALIFKMIPYVNRQTNILSYTQQEQIFDQIEYMLFSDFYVESGYDKTHVSRTKKQLLEYRIFGELVIGFFDKPDELSPNGKYAVVNPLLFYVIMKHQF